MAVQSVHPQVVRGLPPGATLLGPQGEDDVFVGINTENLPRWSPVERSESVRWRPVNFTRRRWAYDGCFYLAFLPEKLDSEGTLFPLSFSWDEICVREVVLQPQSQSSSAPPVKRYQLDPSTQRILWRHLYRADQCISILSTRRFAHNGVSYPSHIILPVAREDLSRTFDSPHLVRKMAMTYRSKVLSSLALLSYTVAMQTHPSEIEDDDAREARRKYIDLCMEHRGTVGILDDESLTKLKDAARFPSWYHMLENHPQFFHSDWLATMWGTWVFDLGWPRLGAFVDITQAADVSAGAAGTFWFEYLPHLLKVMRGTPWWLHYPHAALTACGRLSPLANHYRPSVLEVEEHLQSQRERPSQQAVVPYQLVLPISAPSLSRDHRDASILTPEEAASYVADSDDAMYSLGWESPKTWDGVSGTSLHPARPQDLPDVPPMLENSWSGYYKKLLAWCRLQLAKETDSARQEREDREAAAREPWPWKTELGKRNYRSMFVEWSERLDGIWVPTVCSSKPAEVARLWAKTATGQRMYDSMQDIWHISEFFPREEGATTEDEIRHAQWCRDMGDSEEDLYENASLPHFPEGYDNRAHPLPIALDPLATGSMLSVPVPVVPPIAGMSTEVVLGPEVLHEEMISVQVSDLMFWDARRELPVAMRLEDAWQGWWGLQSTPLSMGPAAAELPALTQKEVLRMVSYEPAHDGQLSEGQWRLLARFLKAFHHEKGQSKDTPPDEIIPAAWCDFVRGSVYTHPCNNTLSLVKLRCVELLDRQVGYVVLPADDSPADSRSWTVVVTSPLCALLIMRRQWGPRSDDIIPQLIARGLQFHLIRPYKSGFQYQDTTTERVGLGRLMVGSRPGLAAYAEYLARRHQLVHGPAGRAAMCAGGILWRLVMDTQGAGAESLWFTDWHRPTFHVAVNGDVWADDELSPQERDVIVGVYRILNGTGNVTNAACKSWWPRQEEWVRSSQYHGYWTAHNEMWFRRRRQDILNGLAEPKSIKEWQAALKGDRQWPPVRDRLEETAGAALRVQLA